MHRGMAKEDDDERHTPRDEREPPVCLPYISAFRFGTPPPPSMSQEVSLATTTMGKRSLAAMNDDEQTPTVPTTDGEEPMVRALVVIVAVVMLAVAMLAVAMLAVVFCCLRLLLF